MTKQKRAVHVPARNAGPPGVLAVAAVLAGCPAELDPGSTAAPALIGRGGQSTYPFAGHLYPRSGPLEYPGRWGTGGVLEVDAPLRSLVRDRERADFGPLYYSFTVNVRVEGLRTLRLQWEADGASTDLAKVSGPCDAQSGAAARAFMTDTSLRETGVATVAAYDMPINARLAGGEGLWWVTCEPDDPGEILSTTPARVDYNVAVLLPQSLFADERGRLLLRSQPLTQGPLSAALKIPIMETPRTFAVAGDSMAWGQGLFYQEKWWWRVYDKARSNNDEFDRLYVRAHSAAHLNGGSDSIAARDDRDCRPSSTHQELPFGADSVQCQLVQIARPSCFMDAAELGQPGLVPAFSCEQKPAASASELMSPLVADMTTPQSIELNHGPRVDFLFLDGCINDVGAVRIHTDLEGSLNTLTNDIDTECDVRNSVPDLRDEFPNANIAWLGFHRTWSNQSAVLNPLRCPASLSIPTLTSVLGYPFSLIAMTASQQAVDDIAERAGLFWERSNQMLTESIAALAGDLPGRGQIRFLPLEFFDAEAAAYAPQSMNWELNCLDPALQTQDSVLTQRYADCAAAISTLTLADIAAGIDWFGTDWSAEASLQAALLFCQRAAFLHPDRKANERMGDLVIEALGGAL